MARRFNRKPLTDEERDARRQADRERIEQAARELLTSDGWQRWIKVRASNGLSRYRVQPVLIVRIEAHAARHHPDLRRRLPRLLALNRVVATATGIRILAPVAVKERDAHGEETGEKRVFFRAVTVWDVTDDRPLARQRAGPARAAVAADHRRQPPPPDRPADRPRRNSATPSRSATSPRTGPAAGATPSAARSSSRPAPPTGRSARWCTSSLTHMALHYADLGS